MREAGCRAISFFRFIGEIKSARIKERKKKMAIYRKGRKSDERNESEF